MAPKRPLSATAPTPSAKTAPPATEGKHRPLSEGRENDPRSRWAEYQRQREEQKRELGDSIALVPTQSFESEVTHVVIDGFNCYRVFQKAGAKLQTYTEEYADDVDEDLEIIRDPISGQYELPLPEVGPQYFKFIIGGRGAVRESIEKETGATIKVPKQGDPDSRLIIRGLSRTSVIGAKQRIDLIVTKSTPLLDYTHFISVPLTSAKEAVAGLIDRIDAKYSTRSRGVERSVFQYPAQLHLTLLMLRLYSSDDLSRAKHLLNQAQNLLDEIFTPADRVLLQGLNYMNDDPSEVHVLYLQVGKNAVYDKIVRLVDLVSRLFIDNGLCTEKEIQHNEKLHATLMNSKWRAAQEVEAPARPPLEDDRAPPPRREERIAFDIRDIMAEFQDVNVGEFPLRTLELSKMGEKLPDGYWLADHSVPFPSVASETGGNRRLPREG